MRFKGIAQGALFYFFLSTPLISLAKINFRTGDYRWSHSIQLKTVDLRVTYSSRSTYIGLFGAGWCSGLDYERTEVGLFHCGRRIRKPPDDLDTRLRLRKELSPKHNSRIFKLFNNKFVYKDNQLVHIHTDSGSIISFKYNDYQNLIRITQSGKDPIKIQYDDKNDRVTQVTQKACNEVLNYKQSARKRWISYNKQCNEQLMNSQNYELTYARTKTGKIYIQEVILKTLKRSTRIQYTDTGEIQNINLSNKLENI